MTTRRKFLGVSCDQCRMNHYVILSSLNKIIDSAGLDSFFWTRVYVRASKLPITTLVLRPKQPLFFIFAADVLTHLFLRQESVAPFLLKLHNWKGLESDATYTSATGGSPHLGTLVHAFCLHHMGSSQ